VAEVLGTLLVQNFAYFGSGLGIHGAIRNGSKKRFVHSLCVTRRPALWQKPRVFAVWLNNLDPVIVHLGPVALHWYGLSYVISALIGYRLYVHLARRGYTDIPPAKVADMITWVGLLGVLLGGRLGWIQFYGRFQDHSDDPYWWWLRVNKGGMSSHGGILGIAIVTFILSRKWKVSWTGIGDSLCVVATVGLFLVRCANFVNGELYGHPTTVPWGVQFASEVRDNPALTEAAGAEMSVFYERGGQLAEAERLIALARTDPAVADRFREILPVRHPSQLYEALLEGALLFAILWIVRTRFRVPRGMITGLFFILYATVRIIGEEFRIPDPAWKMGNWSAGQTLSFYMYAIGAAFIFWALKKRQYEKADARAVTPPKTPV
jgi:phosphatidylglycerol:prolipoprotein diacylglycerol transferase